MALILFIAAVETEATPESSRNIAREMALILCMVAVDMEAEETLKCSRHIFGAMAPMLSLFAVNITASQALTPVKSLSLT